MYHLIFEKNAAKEFSKLSLETQKQVRKAINEKLLVNPDFYLNRFHHFDLYKFRVGNYRLIIKKQANDLILMVVKVGHRKNIYNNVNKLV